MEDLDLVVSNTTIRNCVASQEGGAICMTSADLQMSTSVLELNISNGGEGGGALYSMLGSSMTVVESQFTENRTNKFNQSSKISFCGFGLCFQLAFCGFPMNLRGF